MTTLPQTITKARARLLVRAPFFGSIALGLLWVNAPEVRTMATDGRRVWYNPDWCDAQGVEKTMGVIAHEVLHVVNKHHLRCGERDPELWNIAADLLINRVLEEGSYLLPSDGLFDRERRYAGLATETIYARLLEQCDTRQTQQSDTSAQIGAGSASQSGDGGLSASPDGGTATDPASGDEDGPGGSVAAARSWGEVRDLTTETGRPLSASERRQAEHDLDVRIRQAASAAKRAGKYAGCLTEMVEIATDQVDWRDKFSTTFDGTLRGEVSWSRPNRRFIQHGLYLPGWRRTGAGRVGFVLDTSGSITALELSVYTAAVLGILEETGPEQVALIQCDTEVRHVDYLRAGESFDRIEVEGRGGTRFQPAFDWIVDSGFGANVIVYATDLLCSDEPQDPGLPVIWLTPACGRSVSFGDIIEVRA
jgi:predicted metal-dependent peptidase